MTDNLKKHSSEPTTDTAPVGLENVVATETSLSLVDGAAGRLVVCGFDLDDLANSSFEAVIALLWEDLGPERLSEVDVRIALGAARVELFSTATSLLPHTDGMSPVEALRYMLSSLSDDTVAPHHIVSVAAAPVFAAAISRRRVGKHPVAPDASLGHAADFLRMLHGMPVKQQLIDALDTYLVTVADHGMNASTFAARVIASTQAGMFSAIVGGLCALKGPLHGGAPGPVLNMLDAIGDESQIHNWIADALGRGERLMGFGHRIYRVRDPRADVLKGVVRGMRDGADRIAFAEAVEAEALLQLAKKKPMRPLETNVEFYTALVLEALGFPIDSFTNVFAVGRMAGWTAHVLEQEKHGRLIRPQSRYVGPIRHGSEAPMRDRIGA